MVVSVKFLGHLKSQRASKLHFWFKSYGDFVEWVDFAYLWSFVGGGSAINESTPSSFCIYLDSNICCGYLKRCCPRTLRRYISINIYINIYIYHVSCVACHISHVTCHKCYNVVKLVNGGFIINGAYPV